MQNEVQLDVIREIDPYALQWVVEDRGSYYLIKRTMDLTIALLLLVFLFPLMLVAALVIVAFSPGPIFYTQERVGAKKQNYGTYMYWKRTKFSCYKFRTMKISADPSIHHAYVKALIENNEDQMTALQGTPTQPRKLVNDSRIIPPGKLLRKLSLDELPQLWNVVRGEMSLVGPRPAIPYEVDLYKPWHLQRLESQPGITGLQQVTARSAADFDQQVRLDIQYIENQSIWLDFKIMLKTPFVVISTKGAH